MAVVDIIRKLTPNFLLEWNRGRKKQLVNNNLEEARKNGDIIDCNDIYNSLLKMGIKEGDSVLVHSSLSKIGYLKEGPKTFVDALKKAVGENGNILMPTSPNAVYQLNYIRETPFFDVVNSPSKTGAITEYFRKLPEAKRSLHPTEPVSAIGPLATYFTEDHLNQLTPYNQNSPFYKLGLKKGKILYVGVTLDNAGTSLHTLEDAVDFKFQVYYNEIFEIDVIDYSGNKIRVKTKVHDPEQSKKRKCDGLIPLFEKYGVLTKQTLGKADVLLVEAEGFFNTMIQEYETNGVTMYTPQGS